MKFLIAAALGAATVYAEEPPARKVVDLTHTLRPGVPVFPKGIPFQTENIAGYEQGYYANKILLGEHTGTHVDAASHFAKGRPHVDAIPAEDLILPLVVVDVSEAAGRDPDYAAPRQAFLDWEEKHGKIPPGAFVALRTGWSQRWVNPEAYVNLDDEKIPRYPGFSVDAAEFLVNVRKVKALGIDTLSTDPGRSVAFPVHGLVHGAGLYQVENLTNLEKVPPAGARILVAPLKIKDGSGAPARVLAIIP